MSHVLFIVVLVGIVSILGYFILKGNGSKIRAALKGEWHVPPSGRR